MPIDFPTTRWSLVVRAAGGSHDSSRAALAELLGHYLGPMTTYLVRGRKVPPDAADDLV